MKKFSKILSLVLAVAMMATLVPTYVFASDAQDASNNSIITLIDFGNPKSFGSAVYSTSGVEVSTFAYDGKKSSLKFTMTMVDNGEGGFKSTTGDIDHVINTAERDLTAYETNGTINVKFYSEAAGSKINFNFYNTVKGFSGNNKNYTTTITGGWQVATYKLSEVYEKTGKVSTLSFRINDEGWNNLANNGYKNGDTVYVDSVYLDTGVYTSAYDSMTDDEYVIWNGVDAITSRGGMSETKITDAALTRKGGNAFFRQYTVSENKDTTLTILNKKTVDAQTKVENWETLFNTEGYKYFNIWFYSPEVQRSGAHIVLYTNKRCDSDIDGDGVIKSDDPDDAIYIDGVKQTVNNNVYVDKQYNIPQLNWKGWKLLSFPLPNTADKIISVEVNVGGWQGKAANKTSDDKVIFGMDGAWLSKGDVSPAEQWTAENAAEVVPVITPNEDDIVIGDYNGASTLLANCYNVSLTADNGRVYKSSARMSFQSVTYDILMRVAEKNDDKQVTGEYKSVFNIFGKSSNSTDLISKEDGLNENSYINLWMYIPKPMYTWNGVNYGEITLVLKTGTSLKPVHVIANWTGWKLVSIPIKEISSAIISGGINYIYLTPNGGWYSVKKKTDNNPTPEVIMLERTPEEISKGYVVGGNTNCIALDKNNTSGKLYNNFNFVDVERIWISNGPVTDSFGNVSANDNSSAICPDEAANDVTLFTADSAIDRATVNVLATSGNKTTSVPATIKDGVVTLTNGFEYGKTYKAAISDMYNSNGSKYTGSNEFTFKTETYHVSEIATSEDGKTSTVKMHGILPEDYADAVLVAAVYSANGDVVKLETVNKADYDAQTGEITASIDEVGEGQTVKFLFLSGLSTLKPLADNVRK